MKTAVIFGVTGQDGSYLAELLLGKGYRVVGVSRRTSTPNDGRVRHLAGDPSFELVRGDVTDPGSVQRTLLRGWAYRRQADAAPMEVYNLAAQSHVGDSFLEPHHTTQATYLGCLNVLEGVRAYDALAKETRVYQASSSEMFGSSRSHRVLKADGSAHRGWAHFPDCVFDGMRPDAYQDESTPFAPNSPYAVAKLAAHHLVRVYRESYGLFACSGVLFNHESERRGQEFVTRKITRYVGLWLRNGRTHEGVGRLKLGNLDAARDWGHAADHVRAMWLMLQRETPDDYVVCTGQAHTVREFLLAAFAHAGLKAERVEDLPVEVDPSLFRPCEVPFLRGDASKARRELGWSPEVGFDDLVRRMVYADLAG